MLNYIFMSLFLIASFSTPLFAREDASPLFDLSGSAPLLNPDIERRSIEIPNIDTENFEIGLYAGVLSVENFGSNYVKGASASLFITEDFFLTLNMGYSRIEDDAYREYLPLFGESGGRDVTDSSILLGWNILPGEFFWANQQAFTSDLYLLLGMGTITFDQEEHGTYLAGLGLRIIPRDWFAIRFESKISEYKSNLLGYEKYSHNFDVVTGVSIFF